MNSKFFRKIIKVGLIFFVFFLFSCKKESIPEVVIVVTDSCAGPTVSGAEIRIVEGFFDDRGKLSSTEISPEKIPGKLLGKTDSKGCFSFIPQDRFSSDLFSIVVTKEGFGISIIQDFFAKNEIEKLEVILQPLAGKEATASPIWFSQIKMKEGELLPIQESLKSPIKVTGYDSWETTVLASYPMLKLDKGGKGLAMNIVQVPSDFSRYLATPLDVGMEKKTVEKEYEENAYYINKYKCDFSQFKIDFRLFFYLVCYDIMGNRVQMRIPIEPFSPSSPSKSKNFYDLSRFEMRTFAVNRNLYSLDSDLRKTTGYAIVKMETSFETTWEDVSFQLYMRPAGDWKQRTNPYKLVGEVNVPENFTDYKFEAVFYSGFIQPNDFFEYYIKVLRSGKVVSKYPIGSVAMLPEMPIADYSPTGGQAVSKRDCELQFSVKNWEKIKDYRFSYEFSLEVESVDGFELLGAEYMDGYYKRFLPIQFVCQPTPDGMAGLYVFPSDFSNPPESFCFQKKSSDGHFSINLSELIAFLNLKLNLTPPRSSQKEKISFSPGTAYRWVVSGSKHGAVCVVSWGDLKYSTSYSSSVETNGIGADGYAFFCIK